MAFWTPEEDIILINMVNEHKDVNDIIPVLGKGRDQIAGRIRRLRAAGTLPALDKPSSSERTTRPRVKKPNKKKSDKPTKPKEPPYIPPVRPLHPLEQLGYNDCRWPIGDPGTIGFRFCGEPIRHGSPYCPDHAERAFTGTGRVPRETVMEPAD